MSPTTMSKGLCHVTVNEEALDHRALIRLRIACAHSDGSLDVSTVSPFLPRKELACAGHANVTDCSTIHLVSSAERGVLVSACTTDSQSGEVCLWRLDGKESDSSKQFLFNFCFHDFLYLRYKLVFLITCPVFSLHLCTIRPIYLILQASLFVA